jgi:AcrR family transcriptional regulator
VARPKVHDEVLRVRLLEAAGQVVASEGAGALSVRRIAAAVGTSTTAIYSLFGSKGDLVREVWLEGFRRLAARMEAVPHTDEPLGDLANLGRAYRAHAVGNPAFYEVMFGGAAHEYEPDEADQAEARRSLDALVEGVRRCVEQGAAAGDPEEVAMVLWGLVHGMVSLELHGLSHDGEDAAARFDLALLISGVGIVPR